MHKTLFDVLALLVLAVLTAQSAASPVNERFVPASELQFGIYQLTPVEVNGYLYFAGGISDSTSTQSVYFARIQPDGSLGTWTETQPLPFADQGPSLAAEGKHLYAALFNGTLFRAILGTNGSIDGWQEEAMAAPFHGGRFALQAYEGHLYVFGGWVGATFYSDVFMAPILADGSLGAWMQTTSMPEARQHQSVHFFRDRVYIVGGITDGLSILNSCASAPVNADGSLGTWRTETEALPMPLWYHGTAFMNGEIYLFGGRTAYASGFVSTIMRSAIHPTDGTLMGWQTVGTLPNPAFNQAVGVVHAPILGGITYLIGGGESGNGPATTPETWRTVTPCREDVDFNGTVNVGDLLAVIRAWGICP